MFACSIFLIATWKEKYVIKQGHFLQSLVIFKVSVFNVKLKRLLTKKDKHVLFKEHEDSLRIYHKLY